MCNNIRQRPRQEEEGWLEEDHVGSYGLRVLRLG